MDSEKFEHYLAQNLEPLDTDKHVGFCTGLQTGSFPSAYSHLSHFTHFFNVRQTELELTLFLIQFIRSDGLMSYTHVFQ